MSSRTALPSSLSSPVLRRSPEGITFRTPGSGSRGSDFNSSIASPRGASSQPSAPPASVRSPSPNLSQQNAGSGQASSSYMDPGYSFMLAGVIATIVIYLIVYVVLCIAHLNMTTDLVNGERVLNHGKLLLWTFIIGTLIALVIYAAYRSFR